MRLAAAVLLLLAAPTFAAADADDVLDRLQSEIPSERAWGAYLAGKEGVQDAIPALVELIATVPDRKDKEGQLVVRAAFDALIRLEARVDPDVLAPHLRGRFGAQALLLLSRSDQLRPGPLLALFVKQGSGSVGRFGIAVGNLLLREKAPGFAAHLLGLTRLSLTVRIVDEGFGGGIGRSVSSRFGDGRLEIPERFPPTVFYHLTDREREGAKLLVDGPRPIRWYRVERTGRKLGFGSSGRIVEMDELAPEWLGALSGIPKKEMRLRDRTSLVWTDATAYGERVTARRNAILARHWKLVAVLMEKRALTLEEARALKPEVTIKTRDARKSPAAKLPALPEMPAPPRRPKLPGEQADERVQAD